MSNNRKIHKSVLLKEIIENLDIKPNGCYLDCTLGDGGYSTEILSHLDDGHLISLDYDEESIEFVKDEYKDLINQKNWTIIRENFADLESVLNGLKVDNVDGIVFDLGVSSRQLESSARGFSFLDEDSNLDMRMDQRLSVRAMDLLRVFSEKELNAAINKYGEERYSKRIAKSIKNWTRDHPNAEMKVGDLVNLIRRNVPASYRWGSKHPARRTFQAIRILVNDELNNLQKALSSALSMVSANGRILVVTFHSLEDRIVKQFFNESSEGENFQVLTPKPITPSEEEIKQNPRARSAKLRVLKRLK